MVRLILCFVLVVSSAACWTPRLTQLRPEWGKVEGVADYEITHYTNGTEKLVVWVASPFREARDWKEKHLRLEVLQSDNTWELKEVVFTDPQTNQEKRSGATNEWYLRMRTVLTAIAEANQAQRVAATR
jgi:hypothetical protein